MARRDKRKFKASAFVDALVAGNVGRADALLAEASVESVEDASLDVMERLAERGGSFAILARMMRRFDVNSAEAERMGAVRALGRKALKGLNGYDREKPSMERAGVGVWDVIPAEMLDTSRVDEKILMDWKARAGGAGEMFARGQIGRRELAAAAILCGLAERARMSQLTGMAWVERVEGGIVDTNGDRLRLAAKCYGKYRSAIELLSRAGRCLVENRVIHGKPMEEVVRMRGVAHVVGEVSVRKRCEKAAVLLRDALDMLADILGVREA